jgi:photosystem II stability/assembly factor-like uncharacterized protein
MKKVFVLPLLFVLLLTTGQSCQMGFNSKKKQEVLPDAGIYKSSDSGLTWTHVPNVPTVSGKPSTIGTANILTMEVDPQDNNTIYLGTATKGVYFTYDAGATWQQRPSLSRGKVSAVEVDPSSKCIIYASFKNTVLKTTDCGRTWGTMFIDNDTGSEIIALAVDHYSTNIVYAGTSKGVVHKSFDSGRTWSTPFSKIKGKIVKFMLDSKDSRTIYIPTRANGIYKSVNAGEDWDNLDDYLKEYKGYKSYKNLIFSPAKDNSLVLASGYGLLKTDDGGFTWDPVKLLTEPGKAGINTVAVHPNDDKIFYYTTKNIFYKTVNSGNEWETKKMFSTKAGTNFIINPETPNIMYMGFSYP